MSKKKKVVLNGESETASCRCGFAAKVASKIRMGTNWQAKDVYAFGKLCMTFGV